MQIKKFILFFQTILDNYFIFITFLVTSIITLLKIINRLFDVYPLTNIPFKLLIVYNILLYSILYLCIILNLKKIIFFFKNNKIILKLFDQCLASFDTIFYLYHFNFLKFYIIFLFFIQLLTIFFFTLDFKNNMNEIICIFIVLSFLLKTSLRLNLLINKNIQSEKEIIQIDSTNIGLFKILGLNLDNKGIKEKKLYLIETKLENQRRTMFNRAVFRAIDSSKMVVVASSVVLTPTVSYAYMENHEQNNKDLTTIYSIKEKYRDRFFKKNPNSTPESFDIFLKQNKHYQHEVTDFIRLRKLTVPTILDRLNVSKYFNKDVDVFF